MKKFGYPGWYKGLPADRYAPDATAKDRAGVDALYLKMAERERRSNIRSWLEVLVPVGGMVLLNLGLYVWGTLT